MSELLEAFDGVWIPSIILRDKRLYPLQRCLWGLVWNQHDKERVCFASDKELAQKLNTTPACISSQLNRMRKQGFIQILTKLPGEKRQIRAVYPVEKEESL